MYGLLIFCTVFEVVRPSFIAVRSAINEHRNRGCTAGVFAVHAFPDFVKKSVVKISCISVHYFAEEINKSLLSDWFSPWGFFQG